MLEANNLSAFTDSEDVSAYALPSMNQMGTVDAALQIPVGVIYIAVPFCGVITLFYAVYNCFVAVQEYKNHSTRTSDGTAGTM